jgi:hypothetical protein
LNDSGKPALKEITDSFDTADDREVKNRIKEPAILNMEISATLLRI